MTVRFALVPLSTGVAPDVSRYQVKELLTRPFSALAVPLREAEVMAMPWLPLLLIAAVVVSLVTAGRRWNRRSRDFQYVVFGAAFVVMAVAPVGTAFFVNDDLLGSRYLYLAAAGWSISLATVLRSSMKQAPVAVGATAAIAIVVCWFIVTSMHVRLWTNAAQHREAILEAAEKAVPSGCDEAAALELPDTDAGVPLFLNGFPEAMRRRLPGVRFYSVSGATRERCRLTWTGSGFINQ